MIPVRVHDLKTSRWLKSSRSQIAEKRAGRRSFKVRRVQRRTPRRRGKGELFLRGCRGHRSSWASPVIRTRRFGAFRAQKLLPWNSNSCWGWWVIRSRRQHGLESFEAVLYAMSDWSRYKAQLRRCLDEKWSGENSRKRCMIKRSEVRSMQSELIVHVRPSGEKDDKDHRRIGR